MSSAIAAELQQLRTELNETKTELAKLKLVLSTFFNSVFDRDEARAWRKLAKDAGLELSFQAEEQLLHGKNLPVPPTRVVSNGIGA